MKFKGSNKFSVGDIVYHKKHECLYKITGTDGTNYHPLFITTIKGDRTFRTNRWYIEHATIANTAITRKLYPNYEEDGDRLIVK